MSGRKKWGVFATWTEDGMECRNWFYQRVKGGRVRIEFASQGDAISFITHLEDKDRFGATLIPWEIK